MKFVNLYSLIKELINFWHRILIKIKGFDFIKLKALKTKTI